MTERLALVLINGFVLLIILIMQIITPKVIRKNILFGVKVPEDRVDDEEVEKIQMGFRRDNLLIGIPILLIFSLLLYIFSNPIFQMLLIFIYMGILFLIYLKYNAKVKVLKKERGWDKIGSKMVVVDIKYSRDKSKTGNISSLWFLIPLAITVFNIVLSLVIYPKLPDKIPTHWSFTGEITTYRNKSYGIVLMDDIVQLFMLGLFYFSYWMIGKSKQQINPNNPEESIKGNIVFRKAWSIYLLIITILTILLFTALNLLSYGILFKTTKMVDILTWAVLGFSIIGAIVLSTKIGQGGERLRSKEDIETGKVYDRDDDKLWKLGNIIYYNPEDSSLFIEKRFGVGWTVNTGRPLGMFLMILPIIIVIVTLFKMLNL